MTKHKDHDVQSVNLGAPVAKVFEFIANPANLPQWTVAFKEADAHSARLVTPEGELQIALETRVNQELGTIDWFMTMPDGSMGMAYSRVVEGPDGEAIYSFTLIAPPVPLELVEGTLSAQMGQLKEELATLQQIFGA